jgi:hypothetical protein
VGDGEPLVRVERSSWDRRSIQDPFHYDQAEEWDADIRTELSDSPPRFLLVTASLLAVASLAIALWLVVWILYQQGAVSWTVEYWQALVLSTIYLIVRAVNRSIFPSR